MNRFGEFLKQQRKSADLTQEALARSLRVSNTYIHQLETGKIDAPTERRCRQLARALNLAPSRVWTVARQERLRRYAERVGLEPSALGEGAASDPALVLTPAELALLKLYRRLDPSTRKEFNGLIAMLFRHYPEEEIQETLKEYLRIA